MADRNGYIIRYGFHCDPILKTWKTSDVYKTYPNITSLHYVPHHYCQRTQSFSSDENYHTDNDGYVPQRNCILGTSLGTNGDNPNVLWLLKLPYKFDYDLINDSDDDYLPFIQEIRRRRRRRQLELERRRQRQQQQQQQPEILYQFSRKQGSFWSSCIGQNWFSFNMIVGGDKHVFRFNDECELMFQMKCKSAVLATEFHKKYEPGLFWIGCRNGDIQLIDDRCRYHDPPYQDNTYHHPTVQFHESSSITHLKPLDHISSGHCLLSASMDGSIHLWDVRYAKSTTNNNNNACNHRYYSNKNKNKNKIKSIPLQSFRGHQNEHTRQLAFHLDPETNLFTMAGNDNKVRLWSLTENDPIVDPIWTSPSVFNGHYIPHASILSSSIQNPALPINYNNIPTTNNNHDDNTWKSNPGILICSQPQNDSPSLHWYSISS